MSTSYNLPDHAPSRTMLPGDNPSPDAARDVLAREGVDASNLDDLGRFLAERGWV